LITITRRRVNLIARIIGLDKFLKMLYDCAVKKNNSKGEKIMEILNQILDKLDTGQEILDTDILLSDVEDYIFD